MWSEGKKLAEAARLAARGELLVVPHGTRHKTSEEEAEEALAAFGLRSEAPLQIDETFVLWPECAEVFWLWRAMQTQWFEDMGRKTGLIYTSVESYFNINRVPADKQIELFYGLQIMEVAALNEWNSQPRHGG